MYLSCPLKYKYHYVDGLGTLYRQERPYFSFGESVHHALAKFFRIKNPSERTSDVLQNFLKQSWVSKGYASKEEEADWKSQAVSVLTKFHQLADIKAQPVYIEEFFRIPLGADILSGRIDRVDRTENGYEVIDYKTGKFLPKQEDIDDDFQLAIYQLACAKKYKIVPTKLSVYFLNFDKKLSIEKPFENVPLTEKKVLQYVTAIKEDKEFNASPNPFCNWCDYNVICPAMGIGLDVVKSSEKDEGFRKTIKHLEMMRNDLYALHKASGDFAGILESSVLISKILDVFMEIGRVEKGMLYLRNNAGRFVPAAMKGIVVVGELRPSASGDGAGEIKIKLPQAIKDLSADARFSSIAEKGPGVKSAVLLPLAMNERTEGFLLLMNKKNKTDFNNYDLVFLSNLASSAAVSLHNAKLYELAITDGLTGLFIHRYFQNRLESELIRAKRYNASISLLMLDLDHFKKVNDQYGHPEGDVILRKFAEILLKHTRKVDVAARYGGEEFVIILPETGLAGAELVAEHLRSLIEKTEFLINGKKIPVTSSIGVACWDNVVSKEGFIEQADKALYRAKNEGRNRVCKHI